MRKLLALALALVMSLSLVACGGDSVDKKEVTDAFNSASTSLAEVSTLANENIDKISEETVAALTELSTIFSGYKAEIESADLTQERADEILNELAAYPDQITEYKAVVEEEIATNAGTDGVEITPEQLQALTDAYNSVAPAFNEAYETAEANGWLEDEQTNSEFAVVSGVLTGIGEALTGDLSALAGSNFDELPGAVSELSTGIAELMERVSTPYAG